MRKILYILIFIFINMSNVHAQNEDYLFMIEQAVKAPSGHNTQPWLFKIGENQITILPNFDKALPVVDNSHRELFISIGCAAENLCMAASSLKYKSTIMIDNDGIITVYLEKSSFVEMNPLFNQIEKRQTNRSIYDERIIPDDTMQLAIKNTQKENNIQIYAWKNQTPVFDSLRQYIIEGNNFQMNNESFKNELKSWMRFNKKQSNSTNDGLSYAVFGAPNLPLFISKPIMSSFLNSKRQNKDDLKKINSSSHFVLFTAKENSVSSWINTGRTLQRYLLLLTSINIANAYMNQPCEIIELNSKIRMTLPINGEYPEILLRIGYAKQVTYSKRKNINDVIIK